MTTRRFFGLLIVLVVAGALFGRSYRSGLTELRPSYGEGLQTPTPQQGSERRLEESTPQRLWTIGGDQQLAGDAVLYGSLEVKVGPGGEVFVLDLGDLAIKHFTAEGAFVRSYGNGQGQGPGEFTAVTDFSVVRSGELWVADDSNGRISVFDRTDGSLLRTVRPDAPTYRVLPRADGRFALLHAYMLDDLFSTFDAEGNRLAAFGRFVDQQAEHPLVLDGWLESDGEVGFVYVGRYASLIGRYGMAGEERYLRETIEPVPLPRLMSNGSGTMWVDRDAWPSTLATSVTVDAIHVLSTITKGLKKIGVIDTYGMDDGAYRYSRKVPEACVRVVVTDDHLYTVTETAVSKWSVAR